MIPVQPTDGDLDDLGQALWEILWAQYEDDVMAEVHQAIPPVLLDMTDHMQDLASQHPYITGGIGVGTVVGSVFLGNEFLDEYGSDLNVNTIPINIPLITLPDMTIWPYTFPIGVSAGGGIELNTNTPDIYRGMVEFNY